MKQGPTVPPAGRQGLFSSKKTFLTRFGLRSGPDGSAQAVGFIWSLFRAKPLILVPLRTKVDAFEPDPNFGQPGLELGRSWPTLADHWAESWADLGPTLGQSWVDLVANLG